MARLRHDTRTNKVRLRDIGDRKDIAGRNMAWWGLGLGIAGLVIGIALIAYRFA